MANLLKPLVLKNINLPNRLVMPPMATSASQPNGKVSNEIIDYYDEKSKGGYIGLIVIEHSFITQQGKASDKQLSVADDSCIESLKELAKTIQKNGSKTVMQINHAGNAAKKDVTGMEPVGPSAIRNPRSKSGIVPKELSQHEIATIVEEFKNAAIRVKKAGFDGVQIHSAHGYLLNQFYSPLTNKRTDKYGGDTLGRITIHIEIIKAVREAVGPDFNVSLRLGASDYNENGTTIEDSKIAAVEFEKAGVDILDISGGFSGYNIPGADKQGYFYPLTEALKEVVSIPLILTGGITDPLAAEKLLQDEKTDLIGVGRAILNDSNWAKNAIEGLK